MKSKRQQQQSVPDSPYQQQIQTPTLPNIAGRNIYQLCRNELYSYQPSRSGNLFTRSHDQNQGEEYQQQQQQEQQQYHGDIHGQQMQRQQPGAYRYDYQDWRREYERKLRDLDYQPRELRMLNDQSMPALTPLSDLTHQQEIQRQIKKYKEMREFQKQKERLRLAEKQRQKQRQRQRQRQKDKSKSKQKYNYLIQAEIDDQKFVAPMPRQYKKGNQIKIQQNPALESLTTKSIKIFNQTPHQDAPHHKISANTSNYAHKFTFGNDNAQQLINNMQSLSLHRKSERQNFNHNISANSQHNRSYNHNISQNKQYLKPAYSIPTISPIPPGSQSPNLPLHHTHIPTHTQLHTQPNTNTSVANSHVRKFNIAHTEKQNSIRDTNLTKLSPNKLQEQRIQRYAKSSTSTNQQTYPKASTENLHNLKLESLVLELQKNLDQQHFEIQTLTQQATHYMKLCQQQKQTLISMNIQGMKSQYQQQISQLLAQRQKVEQIIIQLQDDYNEVYQKQQTQLNTIRAKNTELSKQIEEELQRKRALLELIGCKDRELFEEEVQLRENEERIDQLRNIQRKLNIALRELEMLRARGQARDFPRDSSRGRGLQVIREFQTEKQDYSSLQIQKRKQPKSKNKQTQRQVRKSMTKEQIIKQSYESPEPKKQKSFYRQINLGSSQKRYKGYNYSQND